MFGFLKKKIKESIGNIAKAVSKKPEEAAKEEPFDRHQIIEKPADGFAKRPDEEFSTRQGELVGIEPDKIEEIKPEPVTAVSGETKPDERKQGFFEKITKKFTKKITEVTIKPEDIENIIDDLKIGLMENDVALEVAEKICDDVEKNLAGRSVKRAKVEDIVKEALRKSVSGILVQERINITDFVKSKNKPVLFLFIGFNGAGKCVSGDTLIQMGDGQVMPIKELYEKYAGVYKEVSVSDGYYVDPKSKPKVLSAGLKSLKMEHMPVERLWRLKKDKLLEITLSNGQQIEVTPEHPFFMLKDRQIEKIRADAVQPGHFIMVPNVVRTNPSEITAYHILEKVQDPKLFVYSKEFTGYAYAILLKEYKTFRLAWKHLKPGISESTFNLWRAESRMSSELAVKMCQKYPQLKPRLENVVLGYNNSHNRIILSSATSDLYKFMGLFYSEGYMHKKYIDFTNTDGNLINEFLKSAKSAFGIDHSTIKKDKRNTKIRRVIICNSTLSYLIHKLLRIPFYHKSRSMYLPSYMLSVSNDKITQFIKWYWEGDGHVHKNSRALEATTGSIKFAKQLSMLFLRFGIICSVGQKSVGGVKYHRIYVVGKDKIRAFNDKIGTATKARYQAISKVINSPAQFETSELIPNQGILFKSIRENSGLNQTQLSSELGVGNSLISQYESPKCEVSIPISNFRRLLDITNSDNEFAKMLVSGDVRWIRVEKIESSKNADRYVYDLTVANTHNFIANNFIVHNTTTLARIGSYMKNRGLSCVFAAGDSFRAASIEQLQVHGDRLGIKVVKHNYGADSAAVIFDSMKYASAHNIDVVLADTAGRTHVNANLMDELKKVCRVNKPSMKILVLDSLTGNDIVEQARKFDEAIGVDAIVFTKADVYEKGGGILSAAYTIKKPILFLGIGQNYGDLEEFDPDKIVERLFD